MREIGDRREKDRSQRDGRAGARAGSHRQYLRPASIASSAASSRARCRRVAGGAAADRRRATAPPGRRCRRSAPALRRAPRVRAPRPPRAGSCGRCAIRSAMTPRSTAARADLARLLQDAPRQVRQQDLRRRPACRRASRRSRFAARGCCPARGTRPARGAHRPLIAVDRPGAPARARTAR